MKKIFYMFCVLALVVLIVSAGCVDKRTSNDISSNKTRNGSLNNISEMILLSGNITENEKVAPVKALVQNKTKIKKDKNIVSI